MLRGVVLLAICQACAGSVHGVVFVDRNHDGVRQKGEPTVPGVVVTLDRTQSTTTDAQGRYTFMAPSDDGIVWARVPDGFRPGPAWKRAEASADLPLVPLTEDELASPLSFVLAADTHTTAAGVSWGGGDLDDALAQALAMPTPPRFFTVVGDVTQSNHSEEFDRFDRALAKYPIPWIPVPGNHDWYDGGKAWRKRWGPDNYSFDTGNLHVVVWDTNLTDQEQIDFFTADLAHVDPAMVIVALGHGSPSDVVADQLGELGVDYMFTGHWHANRRVRRHDLVEWGTQTMVMGTIDQSPSGYRIVTFVDGVPQVEHRARVVAPHVAVTSPNIDSCASPTGFQVLASAALDATLPAVTARIDCGEPVAMTPIGDAGWSFGAQIGALVPGAHTLEVTATSSSGRRATHAVGFSVCAPPVTTPVAGDWLQSGGDARHAGARAAPLAIPLVQQWATSLGGHVLLGTPLVRGDTVIASIRDLAAGDGGGIVALDLATGAVKWRHVTPFPVRAAPAIGSAAGGDLVVVALDNGEIDALDLGTGEQRWTHDATAGLDSLAASLWGSPTIEAGVVYVAVQGRMSALDLATGAVVWSRDRSPGYPWLGSLAAVTVANGTAIANYARTEGMTGWSATGDKSWELTGPGTIAINATPIASGDDLYFIDGAGNVQAVSLTTRIQRWATHATPDGDDWSYAITAAPALADGRLFVATQYRDLIALDTATGHELWRHSTEGGPLNFAHYRAAQPGFAASPVVTGDLVWIGHPDGHLAALDAAGGGERWSTELGAPIVSAPAPAGDYLIVATFDGTIHALVPGTSARPTQPSDTCEPVAPGDPATPETFVASGSGCCQGSRGSPLTTALLALAVVLGLRGRRRLLRDALGQQ